MENFLKRNYCRGCHARVAVFFPLPSFCLSSLLFILWGVPWLEMARAKWNYSLFKIYSCTLIVYLNI